MHTMSGKQFGKIRQFLNFNDTPTQPQSGTPGNSLLTNIRIVFRPSQKTKYESVNKMEEKNVCNQAFQHSTIIPLKQITEVVL